MALNYNVISERVRFEALTHSYMYGSSWSIYPKTPQVYHRLSKDYAKTPQDHPKNTFTDICFFYTVLILLCLCEVTMRFHMYTLIYPPSFISLYFFNVRL
jgi:hypothetical protein